MSLRPPVLTVIDFERDWATRMGWLIMRLPCRVEMDRVMTQVVLFNTDTKTSLTYEMDYKSTPHENIHRLDEMMGREGWYPVISEPFETEEPLTVAERESLLAKGLSVEEVFSKPGRRVMKHRNWIICRVDLPKNSFRAYWGTERLSVTYPGRVSDFLESLRLKKMSSVGGWSHLKAVEASIDVKLVLPRGGSE